MWTYHSDLLATPVPRYTSFPTAAEFSGDVGATEQQEALERISVDANLSLYVHIPFCREICWYCGCNTGRANRSHRLTDYLLRLEQEAALVASLLGNRGRVVRVAFGGGSPNAISGRQLLDIVDELRRRFSIAEDAIWSIEIDPRGFDETFAAAISSAGFTRASLGVQTFEPLIQSAIGRVQPIETLERSVDWLREAGINSLNFDLMYGLPGQTTKGLMEGIDRALAMGADRLAIFGYAHVPHLIMRQRKIDRTDLPDAEQRFSMAAAAHEKLMRKGWQPVGFDHFASPSDPLAKAARDGQVRRNFQGFTDDHCRSLIGLGASAISRLPELLIQNEKNNGRYGLLVGNGCLPGNRGIALTAQDQERGLMIEELLCNSVADLGRLFDLATIRSAMIPYVNRGLAAWSGDRLAITEAGTPYARVMASKLDPWRMQSRVRFSNAI